MVKNTPASRKTSLHSASSLMKSGTTSWIEIETKPLARICHRRCPCQCHIPVQGNSPKWLQGLIGVAFVKFTGTPLLNQRSCNFKNCDSDARESGTIRYSYRFPTWLLQTGIDFAASWNAMSGLGGTWTLRIPRMINRVHIYNAICHAFEYSSVLEIRRIMRSYGLRGFDSFFDDSHSLFRVRFEDYTYRANMTDACRWLFITTGKMSVRSYLIAAWMSTARDSLPSESSS